MGEPDLPGLTGGRTVAAGSLPSFVHLSVDDVLATLLRAADAAPDRPGCPGADPFVQPELAFLRDLHRRTGATVSLYLFAEGPEGPIERVPDRFAPALAAEASWLRFGFHGRNASVRYGRGGARVRDAVRDHDRIVGNVLRFAGPASLDRMPRVHRFLGRGEVLRAWRDAPHGIVGLLAPDDDRAEAYALPPAARGALRHDGAWFDAGVGSGAGLAYLPSLPRLESDQDPVGTLSAWRERGPRPACAFTHESFLRDPRVRERITPVAAWARAQGVPFGWPDAVVRSAT
ncbi:MAG: hypothetical protein WD336_03120 [Trueperaceae bacterium]